MSTPHHLSCLIVTVTVTFAISPEGNRVQVVARSDPPDMGLFLQSPGPALRADPKAPPRTVTRPAPQSRNPSIGASIALEIPPGPYYVGQAIEAKVALIAGATRPTLSLGTSRDFEITPLSGVEVMPLASATIGGTTTNTNLYRYPVRIVAKRAGDALPLPRIQATTEDETKTVAARSLKVATPPSIGRTGAFLGGIGQVKSAATAVPASIRLGEAFEYRLKVDGPGSIGSTAPRASTLLGSDAPVSQVDPLPIQRTLEQPSATFSFRVRPARPGEFSIAPLLVSTFDPVTRKYQTTAANGVTVRVIDVPNFDQRLTPNVPTRVSGNSVAMVVGIAGLVLAVTLLGWSHRLRRERPIDPPRVAGDLAVWLMGTGKEAIVQNATLALAEFFRQVGDRPPGVLTPDEARTWALQLGGPLGLAERAAQVVASSDQCRYGTADPVADRASLYEAVLEVLGELATCVRTEKPREAPGAA